MMDVIRAKRAGFCMGVQIAAILRNQPGQLPGAGKQVFPIHDDSSFL